MFFMDGVATHFTHTHRHTHTLLFKSPKSKSQYKMKGLACRQKRIFYMLSLILPPG